MQRLIQIDAVWIIIDCIFPCPQPRAPEDSAREREHTSAAQAVYEKMVVDLPSDREQLSEHLLSCKRLLEIEDARRQGVEARLTTIFGLSSIAGTIVLGSILAQPMSLRHGFERLFLAVGLLYLAMQMCSAILAAVLGLRRREYRVIMPVDILPSQSETLAVHLRRQIINSLHILDDDRAINNAKVTQMAVAHRAMLNFLGGLLVLAALGAVHLKVSSQQDAFVDRLWQDHKLQDLLRGPQGPQGTPGIQGPPGAPCTSQPRP